RWHWSLAVHVTWPITSHTPPKHSLVSQALPSLHAVPFGAAGLAEHSPVLGLQVPGRWHWSFAAHATWPTSVQTPAWHEFRSQGLPSLHPVPSGLLVLEQAPVVGSQVPATWHWPAAGQVTGLDPVQTPLMHASLRVQGLPSLQVVPSGAAGLEHVPLPGSHVPATWHWSLAVHAIGFEPVQVPLTQESLRVHALPSLQLVPSAAVGFV